METLLYYLPVGAVAGLIAGLLGLGGGVVIVPALVIAFPLLGIPDEFLMHLVVGTSLAVIVPTSASSVYAHYRRNAIIGQLFRQLGPWMLIGAVIGGQIAHLLPSILLQYIFAVYVLIAASQMLRTATREDTGRSIPGYSGNALAAGVIGALSAMLGIGGGSATVPYLTFFGVNVRNAVATSSACGLVLATSGALTFIYTGWGVDNLPAGTLGYVYLPALLGLVIPSVILAPAGARLAHTLPTATLKKIFAVFLIFMGLRMLLG
ncbi:MAG: sulfite exporter TauE/SafE family protein [Gammaproteobacteria bacterium]